eukprot:scaffold21556_cov120-Isochrysis_galbana.AAC.4
MTARQDRKLGLERTRGKTLASERGAAADDNRRTARPAASRLQSAVARHTCHHVWSVSAEGQAAARSFVSAVFLCC